MKKYFVVVLVLAVMLCFLSIVLFNVRNIADRARAMDCLARLSIASQNYSATQNSFVTSGKRINSTDSFCSSWRVQLLPYLDGQEFYSSYKFMEPWNSEYNISLINKNMYASRNYRIDIKDNIESNVYCLSYPNTKINLENSWKILLYANSDFKQIWTDYRSPVEIFDESKITSLVKGDGYIVFINGNVARVSDGFLLIRCSGTGLDEFLVHP
ncbi:DUF1559 domain-containing protein [Telmatocola sphagniphila]|uniref:DUF1559 domain-containing protein n=1 Tax=Telmatocola sphagniphila TaxID=1123043 RepID=A0A8E6EWE7_9BACT|nr:DUF1559 domain-containing protein [Telmatocola sphagniphila]QVL30056.1 DUF1559 domain-containing protein [Telmatocola sphagniphila]